MEFDRSFFEEEVRDGFYVTADMKKAWAAQLEILNDVDKACRENGIQYFAEWGTLLGAVRHNGFIPWDDDMDICMKRPDFNRFLRIAKDIMPEGYQIFNIGSDKDNDNMLARIINGRTITFNEEHLDKYHGFPYVAGLDIFPLDFIAPNKADDDFLCQIIDIVNSVAKFMRLLEAGEEPLNEENILKLNSNISSIESICGVTLDREKDIIQQLNILVDQLCGLYTEDESEEITIRTIWQENKTYRFPKSYYAKAVRLPFENMTIPVPFGYDAILKKKYGDYMKLVHTWDSHDYPFYTRQENILRERGANLGDYRDDYKTVCSFYKQITEVREKRALLKNTNHRKTVVFMPYKAKNWYAMESIWREYVDNGEYDVKVIPIPYYYKDYKGKVYEYKDDCNYPDYVGLTSYDEYAYEKNDPDIIVIQNPYDEYNIAGTVHPRFFSKNLAIHTNQLIYVPAFVTDEIDPNDMRAYKSMDAYVTSPGVVYADKVIVQSEDMKQLYIKKLCDFFGEDSRKLWEEKISGEGSPLAKIDSRLVRRMRTPDKWKEAVANEDGTYKKMILYYINTNSVLEHGIDIFDKIDRTMKVFMDNLEGVYPLLAFEGNIEDVIESEMPNHLITYKTLIRQYKEFYVTLEEIPIAIEVCDAFYGDASAVAQKCRNAGKPVMIQNVEI